MTRRNKLIIVCSVLLAACVIISTVVLYFCSGLGEAVRSGKLIIFCFIILLCLLSVVIVYYMRFHKDKFEKKLNQEYYVNYEIIRDSITNSQLSNRVKTEIKNDILDLMLSAQNSGKSAMAVIGNTETFLRDIIQAYSSPLKNWMLNIITAVTAFVLFVLGTNVLLWFEQTESFFCINFDLDMVIFIALISLMIPLLKKISSERNNWMFALPLITGILFVLINMILRRFLYGYAVVRLVLDKNVVMIPSAIALAVYIILILLLLSFKIIIRRSMVKIRLH